MKPTVLLIEKKDIFLGNDNNTERAAFIDVLQREKECDVLDIEYQEEIRERVSILRELQRRRALMMSILCEEKIYESEEPENTRHDTRTVALLKRLFPDVPLVVVPYWEKSDTEKRYSKAATIFERRDPAFWEYIDLCREQSVIFMRRYAAHQEIDNLLRVHRYHYGDDDRMLGTPDDNSRIIAEYMRMNMLPALCKAREYDDVLFDRQSEKRTMPHSEFDSEVLLFRNLTEEDKKVILLEIYHMNDGISRGHNAGGFAVDANTGMHSETWEWGLHAFAKDHLHHALEDRKRLPFKKQNDASDDEIIDGAVYKLGRFKVPVVLLRTYFHNQEQCRKAGQHLMRQKKWIIADMDLSLIDDCYEKPQRQEFDQ